MDLSSDNVLRRSPAFVLGWARGLGGQCHLLYQQLSVVSCSPDFLSKQETCIRDHMHLAVRNPFGSAAKKQLSRSLLFCSSHDLIRAGHAQDMQGFATTSGLAEGSGAFVLQPEQRHAEGPQPPQGGAAGGRGAARWEQEEGVDAEDEDEAEAPLEELSQVRHVMTEEDFLPEARLLRDVFDEKFADPRSTDSSRFKWDYWHIPEQYTLIRTMAQSYFPPELYDRLEDALILFGESRLGCRAISPIWMSYYVDGCAQELHCDNRQGQFAFVLSLTEWDVRRFRGGETMLLRPAVLDYWSSLYSSQRGLEQGDLVQLVEPLFNRLTVFDPSTRFSRQCSHPSPYAPDTRIPHGVRPVTGTKDPREARLVLHGWFTEPTPFFTGSLSAEQASEALDDAILEITEVVSDLPPVTGILTIRLHINGADGSVRQIEWLADTLVVLPSGLQMPPDQVRAGVQLVVSEAFLPPEGPRALFPASSDGGDTYITLPLVFE